MRLCFPNIISARSLRLGMSRAPLLIAQSLQLDMLRETTSEMARNGCKKIIIVNGHGGNNSLLPYFAQSQLDSKKDFVVYIHNRSGAYPPGRPCVEVEDRFPCRRIGDGAHDGDASGLGPSRSGRDRIGSKTGTGWTYRRACTRGSGGMPSSRIIMRVMEGLLRRSLVSLI